MSADQHPQVWIDGAGAADRQSIRSDVLKVVKVVHRGQNLASRCPTDETLRLTWCGSPTAGSTRPAGHLRYRCLPFNRRLAAGISLRWISIKERSSWTIGRRRLDRASQPVGGSSGRVQGCIRRLPGGTLGRLSRFTCKGWLDPDMMSGLMWVRLCNATPKLLRPRAATSGPLNPLTRRMPQLERSLIRSAA